MYQLTNKQYRRALSKARSYQEPVVVFYDDCSPLPSTPHYLCRESEYDNNDIGCEILAIVNPDGSID